MLLGHGEQQKAAESILIYKTNISAWKEKKLNDRQNSAKNEKAQVRWMRRTAKDYQTIEYKSNTKVHENLKQKNETKCKTSKKYQANREAQESGTSREHPVEAVKMVTGIANDPYAAGPTQQMERGKGAR